MSVADPWVARMDRLRRQLPLPLLLLSTAGAVVLPSEEPLPPVALVLALVAALWSATVTWRVRVGMPPQRRLAAFAGHTALAAVLVGFASWYGIFAYSGFLLAYPLAGRRARIAGFAVTSLITSAAMTGGYPDGDVSQTVSYLVVAGVMMALVLNSATITTRALEQNDDRGVMIQQLAEANRRLEESMAENAALHERLVAQARAAGVTEERQRLAGEIHDTLAQGLTGIVAQLEAAEHGRHRPEVWSRHLALAKSLARSNLTEARRSVRALRPGQLEDANLPEAVGELARGWSRDTAIPAELGTTGRPLRAAPATEAALFRVAQEALANVAKHAQASTVQLTLTYLDDTLLLDVADDGIGFDPGGRTDGYGLTGMRHRLDGVGGTLTVESSAGYGTTVNAVVPLGAPG
jgi:signal transduction histidine kinase